MFSVRKGFTLVELIIGMVLLGIACAGCLSLLMSQRSAYRDPIIQQNAVQIINKLVNEIKIRAFDENSDIGGGIYRCDEEVIKGFQLASCTTSANFGVDGSESDLADLNDIDDFNTAKLCAKHSGIGCIGDNSDFIPVSFFYEDDSITGYTTGSKLMTLLDGYYVRIVVSSCPLASVSGTSVTLSCSGSASTQTGKKIDISIIQRDDVQVDYSFVKANI